ncbi:hypothetical protein JXJ21_26475 [candidate division KSB1 bacterium]|nr:hypothetical protein [candidate division KSB1 bacterium]
MRKWSAFLMTGLAFGLGWAIRGHFGHEHGAAWAGAMGALAVIVALRREDFARRMPTLAALGAIGWAVGGMMSYGLIVGICRASDFINSWYGFAMLAVIGAGYGFIGGGLLGLGMETTEKKRPDWASLLAQMVAGAWICWGLIIYQLEWKMTPPRSELWAACLGISLALGWYLHRNGFKRALAMGGYAALGAGFGFAFGNFLQIMGNLSGVSFNWWNVMEFSLGFFGGLGMIFAAYTRDWQESVHPSKTANWLSILLLLVLIPLSNLVQAFHIKEFTTMGENAGIADPLNYAYWQIWLGLLVVLIFALPGILAWGRTQDKPAMLNKWIVPLSLTVYSAFYIFFGHIKKGVSYHSFSNQLEQYFYWVILAAITVIWVVAYRRQQVAEIITIQSENWKRWIIWIGALIAITALIALISISSHDGLPGANTRF